MDREVIDQKPESLRRCLQRVAEKCPADPVILGQDPDLRDIVTLNPSRTLQLCVDLGAHLIVEMDVLPLSPRSLPPDWPNDWPPKLKRTYRR